MTDRITFHKGGNISFDGRSAVEVYRATVFESALRLFAKTGIRANRAYTPTAMLRVASEITGQKFARRDYVGAADALKAWRTNPDNIPPVTTE